MAGPLIILGESTRAAARSAIDAGYAPWCIDLRGDRDLREMATVRVCPSDQFPARVLKLLQEAPRHAPILFTAPLENHPAFIEAASFERELLGSSPQAVRLARVPTMLAGLKPIRGLKLPETRTHASLGRRLGRMIFGAFTRKKYLLKPRASSHGRGITWWGPTSRIGADHYLQQYIRGEPHTAVFAADGWSAFLLGVTEKLVGDPSFGASGFVGCGDVGPVKLSEKARAALSHLGVQLTQRNDLRGVFGVDLIMDHGGTLWPIEVNPRYPAAAEVLERRGGVPVLTGRTQVKAGRSMELVGRAVVIARQDVRVPDLWTVLPREEIADVPPVDAPIPRESMICSVIASGLKREEVLAKLRDLAGKVYQACETRP